VVTRWCFCRGKLWHAAKGFLNQSYLQFVAYLEDFQLDSKKGKNLSRLQFIVFQEKTGAISTRGEVHIFEWLWGTLRRAWDGEMVVDDIEHRRLGQLPEQRSSA
jgi:hypothetical protein